MLFSKFVKAHQLKRKFSLRKLAETSDLDSSQLSKILADLLPPYQDLEKLNRLAVALEIQENSEDYERLIDYAKLDAGKLPDYIIENEEVMNSLPAYFRTIDKKKPTKEQLDKIMISIEKELQ